MKGPIARGTIRTSFVLGLRLAVQAGTLLLVARMLGPHRFGAFAGIAALAVVLGTLATFGTQVVLLAEVSKNPAGRDKVLPYAIPTILSCGGTLLLIYLAISSTLFRGTNISWAVLLAIGGAEMLLQPLLGLCVCEHHGLGRIARSQLLKILPLALRLGAAAGIFLLAPDDPLSLYGYGYLASSLVTLSIATRTLPAPWPVMADWRMPHRSELYEAMGYAAVNLTKTGPAELDKTLATKLLPLAAAGMYAAAARVVAAVTLPITAMTLSALPRLFREGQNKPRQTRHLLLWMFTAAAGYSGVLAGILWLAAPLFVWIFGARYQNIDHTIRWLCLAVPGMALRLTAGNVLMSQAKPWLRVGFEAFGLLVLTTGSIYLTGRFGTLGMPLALACAEWGMAIGGIGLIWVIRPRVEREAADLTP